MRAGAWCCWIAAVAAVGVLAWLTWPPLVLVPVAAVLWWFGTVLDAAADSFAADQEAQ